MIPIFTFVVERLELVYRITIFILRTVGANGPLKIAELSR